MSANKGAIGAWGTRKACARGSHVPLSPRERGSATAEFAILMPAVCLVLAVCLSGLQLATRQVQVHDAAAMAARSAARGEDPATIVRQLIPEATVHRENRGNLVCVRVEAPGSPMATLLGFGTVSATSCALNGGH